jgi:DNA-binding NarL/FixJ family response regulator
MREGRFGCDAAPVALRCLIVDDNTRFLEVASTSLARDGLEVVGTATTTEDALRQTERLRPDVVLVDISLGLESGFELARRLVDGFPELQGRVVLISTRSEQDYADLIAASPAAGFLPKARLSADAVRELISGEPA